MNHGIVQEKSGVQEVDNLGCLEKQIVVCAREPPPLPPIDSPLHVTPRIRKPAATLRVTLVYCYQLAFPPNIFNCCRKILQLIESS